MNAVGLAQDSAVLPAPPGVGPTIQRILFATDLHAESEAPFELCLDLCRQFGASLTIVHTRALQDLRLSHAGGATPGGLSDTWCVPASRRLTELAREARKSGQGCRTMLCWGVAHEVIRQIVREDGIDLVVLGSHLIHPVEQALWGSTEEAVLRTVECPVLHVGPMAQTQGCERQPSGPVLFATGFHQKTVQAIRCAAIFARGLDLWLDCLSILPQAIGEGAATQIIPKIVTDALMRLATTETDQGAAARCSVSYGHDVAAAIVTCAREHAARLIVLGVRHHCGLVAHLPHHLTCRIIETAPCPVVTQAFVDEPGAHSPLDA